MTPSTSSSFDVDAEDARVGLTDINVERPENSNVQDTAGDWMERSLSSPSRCRELRERAMTKIFDRRARFAILMLGTALVSDAAHSEGAIAVLRAPDGCVGVGQSTGQTYAEVRARALNECRQAAVESGYSGKNCRVVGTFHFQCAAYAMTKECGGFGWAIASDARSAQAQALANCRASSKNATTCATRPAACD